MRCELPACDRRPGRTQKRLTPAVPVACAKKGGLQTFSATAKSRVDFAEAAIRLSEVPMMHLSASRSIAVIKGQEQKLAESLAIIEDLNDRHALRRKGFEFSPKQFRDCANNGF